jgi:hypothetical protein
LVAALDRALALAQVHDRAVLVRQDLNLDVTGPGDLALEQDRVVAEGGPRLALGRGQGVRERAGFGHGAQAPAAAARARLDQEGHAERRGLGAQTLERLVVAVVARDGREVQPARAPPRFDLAPHGRDRRGRRPDEDQPGVRDGASERRALGEKAVAGVDRVGPQRQRGLDDAPGVQIGFGGLRGTDAATFVHDAQVQGGSVRFAVDAQRDDPALARRACDANRDLAAICDQEPADHDPAFSDAELPASPVEGQLYASLRHAPRG